MVKVVMIAVVAIAAFVAWLAIAIDEPKDWP